MRSYKVGPHPFRTSAVLYRDVRMSRERRRRGAALCGPHFCSMRITQDVRDYAASQGVSESEAINTGMAQKAQEFTRQGAELYRKA
jgi:phosphomethylpyrimidine synthase